MRNDHADGSGGDSTILEGVRVVVGRSVDNDENAVIKTFDATGEQTFRTP
jgi:hypothetical protein